MPITADIHNLSEASNKTLNSYIEAFCTNPDYQNTLVMIQEFKASLYAFSSANENMQKAMGWWVSGFLQKLIRHLHLIKGRPETTDSNFLSFIVHFPFAEDSLLYKPMTQLISTAAVYPLTQTEFLGIIQTATVMIDLNSEQSGEYLEKLKILLRQNINVFNLYVRTLIAKNNRINRLFLDEQFHWLEAVCLAWSTLDFESVCWFILQWINDLRWIRPVSERKSLLLEMEKAYHHSETLNQVIICFELFNLPEKDLPSAEKLYYMEILRVMPQSLLTVNQLQAIYYFSGNIKSSVDSSLKESVADFQQSNYYTYKRWEKVRQITSYLRNHISPEEFIVIQAKIELKTISLINDINLQSNDYVEALQANFQKIEELYRQVEALSLTDALTGLHNRRYLQLNVHEFILLARRHKAPISIAMLDIDFFKKVNDTYGHLTGDYILQQLACILQEHFRKSDYVIRYGGEEFLVMQFDNSFDNASISMEKLRKNVETHCFVYNRTEIPITISIGFASFIFTRENRDYTLDYLISAADTVLYQSKHNGRNRVTGCIVD